MMAIIKPQAQGITKIAISFRNRLEVARSKGRNAHLLVVLTIAGVIIVAGVLVFGAMLLPGLLLPPLWGDLRLFPSIGLPTIILILAIQLVVMRHFQGIISRRMAIAQLKNRISEFKHVVLDGLDDLAAKEDGPGKEAALEALKSKYYSRAIYDLIQQDIFGYSRIYLFGVRLRYLLDEDVLIHIKGTRE
jgi:hypothetical protein